MGAEEVRVDNVGRPPGAVAAPAVDGADVSACSGVSDAGGLPLMLLAIACLQKVESGLKRVKRIWIHVR